MKTVEESAQNIAQHFVLTWQQLLQFELAILLAIAVVAGGIWGFIEIADEVLEGNTRALEERLILSLRNPADLSDPIGEKWLEESMRDYTAMGGGSVLIYLTLGLVGYLLLSNKPQAAWLVLATVAGGALLSLLLKQGFDRPRPDLVPHATYAAHASFPSGHSMLSAATYLTLGALLARLHSKKRVKIYILLLVVVLTLLIGVSRIYLGVHWPTDVLAGWTAGAVWAAICWILAWWLQKRGQVEQPTE